jgi:hypothetical protein
MRENFPDFLCMNAMHKSVSSLFLVSHPRMLHLKSTLCYLDATAIVHQPEFAGRNNMKPQYPASDWNTTILRFTAATMAGIFTFDSFIIASLVVPAVVALDPHVAVLLPLQSSQP